LKWFQCLVQVAIDCRVSKTCVKVGAVVWQSYVCSFVCESLHLTVPTLTCPSMEATSYQS
jgi:hypothetical protein